MTKSTDQPQRPLHGVFPICATPFTAADEIDVPSLRRIVNHIVKSGAHGLVYPAIASEFQTLSDRERRTAVEVVSAATAGRTALVIGISSSDSAVPPLLADEAAALGADAVILMPTPRIGDDEAALDGMFAEVAARCDRPIILQNAPRPLGPELSADAVLRLIARVPQIRYVKEETPPCGQRISALIEGAPDTVLGIFGGAGGRFLIDELARGAAGSMPACEFSGIHVEIYKTYRAGNHDRARALANLLLPLLSFESVYRTTATKQILHQMGIIANTRCRDGNIALDNFDLGELAAILTDLHSNYPLAPEKQAS